MENFNFKSNELKICSKIRYNSIIVTEIKLKLCNLLQEYRIIQNTEKSDNVNTLAHPRRALPKKLGSGVWARFQKPLAYLLCDFPYSIYDLAENLSHHFLINTVFQDGGMEKKQFLLKKNEIKTRVQKSIRCILPKWQQNG